MSPAPTVASSPPATSPRFPIKHGLGAQQADTAAAAIAQLAGADLQPPAFRAEMRGKLLTGGRPLYLRAT